MEWQGILALVLGIPFMLFTYVYLWYLIIDGVREAIKEALPRKGKGNRHQHMTTSNLEF